MNPRTTAPDWNAYILSDRIFLLMQSRWDDRQCQASMQMDCAAGEVWAEALGHKLGNEWLLGMIARWLRVPVMAQPAQRIQNNQVKAHLPSSVPS